MTDNQDKNLPGEEIRHGDGEEELNPAEQDNIQQGEVSGPDKIQNGNFLDLIYGVLFDPGRTFKEVAANPPLWESVLIYAIITVLSSVMGMFINLQTSPMGVSDYPRLVAQIIRGMLPVFVLSVVLLQFIKWFAYSALLHLLADLYGGRGTARGVFTVYGLAGLPTLFIIPFHLLTMAVIPGSSFLKVFIIPVSLALAIWGIILLIMGIREVHHFSTGRAVAVVFTPVLVVVVLIMAAIVVFVSVVASIPSQMPWHSLF